MIKNLLIFFVWLKKVGRNSRNFKEVGFGMILKFAN